MRNACVFALLFLAAAGARAQDVQVTASVEAETVGVNDTVLLTITVSGRDSGDATPPPRLPRFRGLQVAGGPNVSTQFQWINGRSSSSKSFTYSLIPEKEGELTIDPIEVTVGNQTYRTKSIRVRVVPGSTRPAQARRRPLDPFGDMGLGPQRSARVGDEVFVAAELDRSTAYPGQQVTLSYHLYTQVSVTGIQVQESPPLTGFWVEDLQVESSPTGVRRVVNGREYLDYVVRRQAIFPNAAGRAKIAPTTFAVSVKTAGDFFGVFAQPETIYRKTKEVTLDVRPLPEAGRPQGFSNAVGSFTLSSSLDKSAAATGDAVSLRVTLAGRGNLKTIGDIQLPPLPDFTIYSSKRADNVRPAEGNQIGGDKTWEYVIVPRAPGEQTIPALTFAYFDPERERYETVSTASLRLGVSPGRDTGGAITGLSGLGKQTVTRQGSDIHFIKLAAADLDGRGSAPAAAWYWVLAALALSFNAGAAVYARERSRADSQPGLARRRVARGAAFRRLRSAEKDRHADARRFYDEAALALSGFLTDRFGLPEIKLTGDTLERELADKSIDRATLDEVVAVMAECDFGRFVSASAQPEKRREIADRMRRLIDRLERS
jgi:hypothetical protein